MNIQVSYFILCMEYTAKFQRLFAIKKKIWLLVVGLVAATHLFCLSIVLPHGNSLLSLLPDSNISIHGRRSVSSASSTVKSVMVRRDSFLSSTSNLVNISPSVVELEKSTYNNGLGGVLRGQDRMVAENDEDSDDKFTSDDEDPDKDSDFVENDNIDSDLPFEEAADTNESFVVENVKTQDHGFLLEGASKTLDGLMQKSDGVSVDKIPTASTIVLLPTIASPAELLVNISMQKNSVATDFTHNLSSVEEEVETLQDHQVNLRLFQRNSATTNNTAGVASSPVKKKMRCDMPPKSITSIDEMKHLLVRNRARSRAMRPRWSSVRDHEILAAKLQIDNAPVLKTDRELHAPVFQNVSKFKRSYELMERVLRVYVYKDGGKPIFHQPILKGLYASEGWFMKLMEGNKQFVVNDPRKAHLFYMPFSSRMLEYSLYVRNSHNRTNLRQYLKQYSEKIAAKYTFWNRTGGADHFLVACHDWAPYETRHHMEHCIKALCNADVTAGFKIGRDVSLPETYVRSARNPLRDLGGKPPSQRHILAFFAGNMHGYLRPILLKYWKNRDPDMKIFGAMPPGVANRMNYINHMKSSKYCICAKGYEVNSPRVVEAIFYECVPVIISDNFVPPFFGVLNWDAFSVIVAEKDIPHLKDILLSIPERRYLEMQLGVRKIQRHFLWHAKPLKYDLFYMTLHSIWYNRVFQIKGR